MEWNGIFSMEDKKYGMEFKNHGMEFQKTWNTYKIKGPSIFFDTSFFNFI